MPMIRDSNGAVAFDGRTEQELRRRIGVLEHQCGILSNQLRGGHRECDPRTDVKHPGHVLVELGWAYLPDEPGEPDDEIGAYWRDPEEQGTGRYSVMPLTAALSIAIRRLMGQKAGRPKAWTERLVEDDRG